MFFTHLDFTAYVGVDSELLLILWGTVAFMKPLLKSRCVPLLFEQIYTMPRREFKGGQKYTYKCGTTTFLGEVNSVSGSVPLSFLIL